MEGRGISKSEQPKPARTCVDVHTHIYTLYMPAIFIIPSSLAMLRNIFRDSRSGWEGQTTRVCDGVAEFIPTVCLRLTHLHTVTGMTVPYTVTSSSPSRKWTVEVFLGSRNKKFPGFSTDHFLHSAAYTKQKWFPIPALQTILSTTTSYFPFIHQNSHFLKQSGHKKLCPQHWSDHPIWCLYHYFGEYYLAQTKLDNIMDRVVAGLCR